MDSKNRNLFIIFCSFVLITACSSGPSIKSAKDDKVIISAIPENFLEAYQLAQKECKKNDKSASYIADPASDLKEVAFDCVGEETEAVVEPEVEVETEVETEIQTEMETTPEEEPTQ